MSDLAAAPPVPRASVPRVDPRALLLLAWAAIAIVSVVAGGVPDLGADDATRLVEVRDLIAGQAWGDLVLHRLSPPGGVPMHWSRLVDAPLAMLVLALRPFLGQPLAEAVTVTVWPLGLLLALMGLVMATAKALAGRAGALLALLLTTLSVPALVHFQPGSIDHHNVQLVLTLAMTLAAMRSSTSPRAPALAAILGATSLAVGLEMLPIVACIGASIALALIVHGRSYARAAGTFGISLALAAIALRLAAPGPELLGPAVCDAFGAPVLVLCTGGGAALALASAGCARLDTMAPRLVLCLACGSAALVALAVAFPQCLGSPYGALDPRMTALWLNTVAESQSVLEAMGTVPGVIGPIFAFALMSAGFGIAVAIRLEGERRFAMLVLVAATLTHVAAGAWQIRGAVAAAVFATPLLAACLACAAERWPRLTLPRLLIAALVLSPTSLGIVAGAAARAGTGTPPAGRFATCWTPADIAPLRSLPPGRVMAAIDLGPKILEATPHAVYAAPYHRNGQGNGALFDVMLSEPDAAARRLGEVGANYVAVCPGSMDERRYALRAPNGLAARLASGETFGFLEPVALPGTGLRVWRVVALR